MSEEQNNSIDSESGAPEPAPAEPAGNASLEEQLAATRGERDETREAIDWFREHSALKVGPAR